MSNALKEITSLTLQFEDININSFSMQKCSCGADVKLEDYKNSSIHEDGFFQYKLTIFNELTGKS